MAEIDYAFEADTEVQTITGGTGASTYQDVDSASHVAGSFFNITGTEYLIVATCQIGCTSGQEKVKVRLVHGSTEFAGSERIHEQSSHETESSNGSFTSYMFMTKYNPSAQEDVKFQYARQDDDTGADAKIDQIAIFVLNLSDDLEDAADWWFDEKTSNDDLSLSYRTQATKTFTPTNAGNHLVIFGGANNIGDSGIGYHCRLNATGTISTSEPEYTRESEDTDELRGFWGMRVMNLDVESQTMNVQMKDDDYIHQHTYSSIFILDLSVFDTVTNSPYVSGATNLTTSWGEIASVTHPPTSGNHWILGCARKRWVSGVDSDRIGMGVRLQKPTDADTPSTAASSSWTDDSTELNQAENNQSDADPAHVQTVESQTGSTDYDFDVITDRTSETWASDQYSLIAISMELAAGDETPVNASQASVMESLGAIDQSEPVVDESIQVAEESEPVAAETLQAVNLTESPVAESKAAALATESPVAESKAAALATESPVAESKAAALATESPVAESKAAALATESPVAESLAAALATESPVAESLIGAIASINIAIESKINPLTGLVSIVSSDGDVLLLNKVADGDVMLLKNTKHDATIV